MANSPTIKGITTISWGTEGKMDTPAGAIVESIDLKDRNGKPISEIENGDGASVAGVLLDDGFDAEIKATYDTAKTWPVQGDTVILTLKNGTTRSCVVVNQPLNSITFTRKKEASISISLIYRPGW